MKNDFFRIDSIFLPNTQNNGTDWIETDTYLDEENGDTQLFLLDCKTAKDAQYVFNSIELGPAASSPMLVNPHSPSQSSAVSTPSTPPTPLSSRRPDYYLEQIEQYLLASKILLEDMFDARFENPCGAIVDWIEVSLDPLSVNYMHSSSDDETTELETEEENNDIYVDIDSLSESEDEKVLVIDDEYDFSSDSFSDSEDENKKQSENKKFENTYELNDILGGTRWVRKKHKDQANPITQGDCYPALTYNNSRNINNQNASILWLTAAPYHGQPMLYSYGLTQAQAKIIENNIYTDAKNKNIPYGKNCANGLTNLNGVLLVSQDYLNQIYGVPELAKFERGLYDKNSNKRVLLEQVPDITVSVNGKEQHVPSFQPTKVMFK